MGLSNLMNNKFQGIKQIFLHGDKCDGRVIGSPSYTKVGHFYPSDLDHIKNGLEYLIKRKIIDVNKPFFDAGAGDGRVIVITACIYGIPSFGLEYDMQVVKDGIWKINRLKKEKLLTQEVPMLLMQGDFTKDDDYEKLGLRFEDIGTVFNFDNNYLRIAKKMAKQSPSGTIFLFKRIAQRIESFDRLKFHKQITLSNDKEASYNLCVYKKL